MELTKREQKLLALAQQTKLRPGSDRWFLVSLLAFLGIAICLIGLALVLTGIYSGNGSGSITKGNMSYCVIQLFYFLFIWFWSYDHIHSFSLIRKLAESANYHSLSRESTVEESPAFSNE